MKIKNFIYAAIAMCCTALPLISCSEESILTNSNDTSYINFEKDFTKDTTIVSFKMYKEGENARIAIPVKAFGRVLTEDLHFHVAIDEKRTTLPSDCYILPEDCVIKHDAEENFFYVELKKSPEMETKSFLLTLQVVEEGSTKQGTREYARVILNVSDMIFKPDWWSLTGASGRSDVDDYYLGEYYEDKYLMFLDELKKDDVIFDGKNKQMLRTYSLKLKNTLKNINAERAAQGLGPLTDRKTGIEIQVPIAG